MQNLVGGVSTKSPPTEKNKNLTWIKDIYWWLEEYSCVLVPRNKQWFQSVLPEFENIWKILGNVFF